MHRISRRRLLQAAGLLTATAVTGGCAGGGDSGDDGAATLKWWDHFGPLEDLHKSMLQDWSKGPGGVPVQYTRYQAEAMGRAMQLARQSKQLPDVHSLAGLEFPPATLQREGWFQPAQFDDETLARFGDGALIEGLTTFDGKVYSFPIFSFRQHTSANWFNRELVAKAGLDPESPPQTFDEFRTACATVKRKTGAHGFVFPFKAPSGGAPHLHTLAASCGFAGSIQSGGVDFRTGEFGFHTEPYLTVFEFLKSLQTDKLMLPGATSMNGKQARARWAAGGCAYWFEGPWCPGVVVQDLAGFADKLAVGPLLVPNSGDAPTAYSGPKNGAFYLSDQSEHPDKASAAMSLFTTEEYARSLAENMDQPPADLSVIDKVDVHPTYRKVIGMYQEQVFLAPATIARNPDVAEVVARTKPVTPSLGDILGGMFSGQITDVAKALKEHSDKRTEARAAALDEAKQEGIEVDAGVWAFDNWEPRKDYTPEMYGK